MRSAARGRLTQYPDAVLAQVRHGSVQVLDVQRDVVAADIAVAGWLEPPFRGGVVEDLEDRLAAAAEEPVLRDCGARVHVQVFAHPVVIGVRERPERVQVLAAQDVDQEAARLVQIGHGEAQMIDAAQSR